MGQPNDEKSENVACLSEEEGGQEINMSKEHSDSESETENKRGAFSEFQKELEKHETPENKISTILQFMETSISQGGSPSFRNFWEARKLCLALFKEENLSFAVRSHLWSKYIELSKEAHRLKEVLDEQSAFAAEQIKLAINALEQDLEKMSDPKQFGPAIEFDPSAKFMQGKIDDYQSIQQELSLLNSFAARINALRKELIKTDMRIRFKNAFFQQLSKAGDSVFPRRKELIKTISQNFTQDIDTFIENYFSSETFSEPLYFLRDEIKSLQNMAKVLTLNTQSFNKTRMKLSECWDRIKKIEKGRKKERAQLHATFKEEAAKIEPRIDEIEKQYEAGELNDAALFSSLEEVNQSMRDLRLSREDVKRLRSRLNHLRSRQAEKAAALEKEKRHKQKQIEEEQKAYFNEKIGELESLVKNASSQSIETTNALKEQLESDLHSLQLTKYQTQDIERQLRLLDDQMSKLKIANLSEDDREAYDQLHELLKEFKKKRKAIREQLEDYRKASGSSGLDFEQALKQSELQEQEKERLADVDREIELIEKRIKELSNKI